MLRFTWNSKVLLITLIALQYHVFILIDMPSEQLCKHLSPVLLYCTAVYCFIQKLMLINYTEYN